MKKAEIILIVLSILGLVLSIFLIPGGNFSMVIGLGCLSMLYCYLGFALFNQIRFRNIFKKSSYSNIKVLHIVGAIGVGIALSVTIVGILFRAMSWPGASAMLLIGMITLIIPGVIAGIKYISDEKPFYRNILLYIVPTGIVATIFFFFGGEIFYDFKYREYPEFLSAYYDAMNHPDNEELWMKVEEERRKIHPEE